MAEKKIHICFVLDHVLQHYRIPLFRRLKDQGFDITICYPEWFKRKSPSLSELDSDLADSVIAIPHKNRRLSGLFYFGVRDLNRYDLVIFMQDLRVIDFWLATLNPFKSYKMIHWGIGTANFEKKHPMDAAIRNVLAKFSSSLILYSDEARKRYSLSNQEKIVVANNTIENKERANFSGEEKDSFLFIGQLDKRKGLSELIRAFADYLEKADEMDIRKLVIIGEGEMYDEVTSFTKRLGIEKNIQFAGAIKRDSRKKQFFKKAQICISLNQAGLAVLESFSYGVPFVTLKDSETGGERFNIRHRQTGFLLESSKELADLLYYTQKHQAELRQIGSNAYHFYNEERSMERMAQAFIKAIDIALN